MILIFKMHSVTGESRHGALELIPVIPDGLIIYTISIIKDL